MTQITQHFSEDEFRCRCGCGVLKIDHSFVYMLEELRIQLGSPIKITSGYRCPKHNLNVGGSPKSMHMLGRAADVSVANGPELYALLSCVYKLDVFGGVGIGLSFVHLDNRSRKISWGY